MPLPVSSRRHHHHHHPGGPSSSSSSSMPRYKRVLMGFLVILGGSCYLAFFLFSSQHALKQESSSTSNIDFMHPKESLLALFQSSTSDPTDAAAAAAAEEKKHTIKTKIVFDRMVEMPPLPPPKKKVEEAAAAPPPPPVEEAKPVPEPPAQPQPPPPKQEQQQQQPKQQQEQQPAAADTTVSAKINMNNNNLIPADEGALECLNDDPKKTYRRGEKGSIVYWRKWTDKTPIWTSPFKAQNTAADPKYVTFEPDNGGWNNIRMAMEIAFVFAMATGRTLVVPDEYPMYLLGKEGKMHDFDSFYDLQEIGKYIPILKMRDFLAKEACTGQLKDGELPPGNATVHERKRPLWEYIRRNTDAFPVAAEGHVVVFGEPEDAKTKEDITRLRPEFEDFVGDRKLQLYTKNLQSKKVLHFTSDMDGALRYLAHFHGFFFFIDKKADNFAKRFVRDLLHYEPEIYCHAARLVDEIREETKDEGGEYDAIHIRRGDFQYPDTRLDAEVIFDNVKDVIPEGSYVYVLTDEHNATYFDPVRDRYRLRFLKDYHEAAGLHDMNPNLAGMVEQAVASGARNFVGTFYSTFTGYTTRLRGYLGKNPGHYSMPEFKDQLQDLQDPFYASPPFFFRDWPAAYLGIDEE